MRVKLRYIGEKPLKVTNNPVRWLRKGSNYQCQGDEAEMLMRKHKDKFFVLRDAYGELGDVIPAVPSDGGVVSQDDPDQKKGIAQSKKRGKKKP